MRISKQTSGDIQEIDMSEAIDIQVTKLHSRLVRNLNNMHIFLQQAIPLLNKVQHDDVGKESLRKYVVPSLTGVGHARRSRNELESIFEEFVSKRLYEHFLIMAVARFESFLVDVLRRILRRYPEKLGANVQGDKVDRSIPLDVLLKADDLEAVLDDVIERRLTAILYASPQVYLTHLNSITGIETKDDRFLEFIEIKATRDILIHNDGIANAVYMEKAKEKARGENSIRLVVDADYFGKALAVMKSLSNVISDGVDENFSRPLGNEAGAKKK